MEEKKYSCRHQWMVYVALWALFEPGFRKKARAGEGHHAAVWY